MTQAALGSDSHERTGRRRPFSTWVKKLANFKNGSSSAEGSKHGHSKRDQLKASKKRPSKQNNPYPQSGCIAPPRHHSQPSLSTNHTGVTTDMSPEQSRTSLNSSVDGHAPPTAGGLSMAGTVSTDHEASRSINAPSHMTSSVGGTSRTANGRKGGDSTFSSPAPSVRSLTTTLTTIQSMAVNGNQHQGQSSTHHQNSNSQNIQFSQPFPTASPASAIPAHLAPHVPGGQPATYQSATANNLLTDNASILTLASSTKRRRRRSFDTDASVRAMAPSSLWGGSRESLPLSILSANMDGIPATPGLHQTSSRIGAGNERNSIYSTTGIAPALPSERNSFYAKQSIAGDAASVRSGLYGHGRAESISGSVAGVASPLASPREMLERGPFAEKDENHALDGQEKE
ncbi:hypothetical protein JX265_010759 [Neoarthrinium moseri]|uniref:Uncharacterized protein n=1 Tax=Neoarthrinium moseri TaxID=1658444 RepID=A0A9P9WDU6_9PEZI|nr:uncharacterized protein JN550_007274 [Neoarthrinium moseri]KAI1851676.1 hypothetical protein JX266_003138 [Neoarthrinium moseri]KAI1858666.1 hypothetical protein JX265_010759 [Neoarthrinium moseri]KAI1867222.1 hypothetical protein JN550_007274 [Neoarthrinium moseri]